MRSPAILAVDGGGSKVDAALVARNGELLAAARGRNVEDVDTIAGDAPGATDREIDFRMMATAVGTAVADACDQAGIDSNARPVAEFGSFCLAGADLPADDRRLRGILRDRGWVSEDQLRNDTFAVLRAGTERRWGVAVVCGYGTNCSAVAPDGRMFRLPALGFVSGDWGGGRDIGGAALWHALRAKDGRGERTLLEELVPDHFGVRRPREVLEAVHFGRMSEDRLAELAPVVFRAARDGDAVARGIIDRQADEVATMAGAAVRRLRMTRLDVEVVLGGGVFHNDDPEFFERIRRALTAIAPRARMAVLEAPPVVGAALLGLDHLGAGPKAGERLRAALTHQRLNAET